MALRFTIPPIDEIVLDNGLTLLLMPESEQEATVVALQLPFGRFNDPTGREGCAELCVALMQKGPRGSTFDQFSDAFEQRGASLFADVGEEHVTLGIKMLSRFKDTLFTCFWEMITSPLLDNGELCRLRREMVTALRAETVDPASIANRHFYHELAGPLHPAGRPPTIRSVNHLRHEHIVAFYNEQVIPDGATLVIAGDFAADWFAGEHRSMVASWQRCLRTSSSAVPAVPHHRAIRFVEKKERTQVALVIGQAAPGETDRYRHPVALANYIFGAGNFSSRLMSRIRTSAGKTYGIAAHLAAERCFGALSIVTSTLTSHLEEVVAAILHEFSVFVEDGVSDAELDTARNFVIGNMAFQLEGITNLVEKLLWLRFYHRSIDYLENFDRMIGDLTTQEVNTAIRACFDPDKLIIIAAGPRNGVVTALEKFGPVQRFSGKAYL